MDKSSTHSHQRIDLQVTEPRTGGRGYAVLHVTQTYPRATSRSTVPQSGHFG